jgi:putative transposase
MRARNIRRCGSGRRCCQPHAASIGTVGDAFDKALVETTIGLHTHECVRPDSSFRRGPLDRLADLEMITADWVHRYHTSRLMHLLGRIPPAEAEAD